MKRLGDMSERELKQLKQSFTNKIGEVIRIEREKKRLSQEELADLAGFYRTYIGHIETGTYSPSAFTLWRIAEAMDIDLATLLKRLK